MQLIILVPAPDGRELEIKQEFDRTILVQLFEAAANECKLVCNNGLVLGLGNDDIKLRPLRGSEIIKPNGFSVPFGPDRIGNA